MRKTLVTVLAMGVVMSPLALAADKESSATDRLDASADVLNDMMHASDKGIPQDLMNRAQCVVVIPNMKKAGFIFGAKYGRGYAVCRRRGGSGWTAPAGMRIEGGSFGLQIGGSESDAVVLVNSESAIKHLLEDKFTLGGRRHGGGGAGGTGCLRGDRRRAACRDAVVFAFARHFRGDRAGRCDAASRQRSRQRALRPRRYEPGNPDHERSSGTRLRCQAGASAESRIGV